MSGATDETARIREQIEHTRADLTDTIGELQDRLSPEQLMNQAGGAVRDAVGQKVKNMVNSATDTARTVADQARTSAESLKRQAELHPWPALLAVGGLAWWMSRSARGSSSSASKTVGQVLPALAAGALGYFLLSQQRGNRSWQDGYGESEDYRRQDFAEGPLAARAGAVGDRVRQLGETAEEYRQRAQAAVGNYAGQVGEQARHLGEVARTQMEGARTRIEGARTRIEETRTRLAERSEAITDDVGRWVDDNPLTVGVAAFALGAVAGLSVPVTDAEQRAVGATRSLVEQAGRVADAALGPSA